MNAPEHLEEFRELCEKLLEDRITAQEMTRLEMLFLSSQPLRREFVELSHLHASLASMARKAGWQAILDGEASTPETQASKQASLPGPSGGKTRIWTAVAATLALALSLVMILRPAPQAPKNLTFATISTTDGSRWISASIPTANDTRIGVGRVQLADGIAKFVFDNGAKVEIEGPADFEIFSDMRCELHTGKLVATMSPTSKGFSIETPDALLIDQGTSFGVNVTDQGMSSLQVFDGLVDIKHHESGTKLSIREQEAAEISQQGVAKYSNFTEAFRGGFSKSDSEEERRQIQLTTATGAGQDQWIIRDPDERYGPDDLLMIKLAKRDYKQFDRKIYLQFDLTKIDLTRLEEASLTMTASPTGIGYASRMPDATFEVFALTDDQLDAWAMDDLTWENAPANVPSGDQLDETKTTPLGTFTIPRGRKQGTYSISGASLVDLIKSDANRLVTLIIVPKTREAISGALVHGFAAGNHLTLPPPTLRLIMEK
ncbi:FecR protein [Bremerella volcania]|uniref:FecR protein n=1 Tax=Bremerella volcania TaxID=2527984 RepID=A0A518C9R1_9BACT|nr:FecR domain-containing protein [Bremerella volcania]QDU75950.1 FecR protein [Bremerella volcania]